MTNIFKIDLDISDVSKVYIGNDRGSETKLAQLMQELVFNAIKNVSFIDKNKRSVIIKINLEDELQISISNTYDKDRRVKTTALGNIIIKILLIQFRALSFQAHKRIGIGLRLNCQISGIRKDKYYENFVCRG